MINEIIMRFPCKPKQGKRNIKYRQYFHTNIGISHTGWYTQAIARVLAFPLTLAPLGVDLKVRPAT